MLWNHIKGHQDIKRILATQIKSNRVGHAYLFVGSHGIGKFMIALAFTVELLCRNERHSDKALNCKQFIMRNIHPDVRVWKTDKKNFSVKDIRLWQKDVWLPPSVSDKKVVIIDEAEKLTINAQNALLKLLEEPPSDTIFILITDNVADIINTVVSRCRTINFKKLSHNELNEVLSKIIEDKKYKDLLLHISNGSPGQALELANSVDLNQIVIRVTSFINLLNNNKVTSLFQFVAELIRDDINIDAFLYVIETIWGMALRQNNSVFDIIGTHPDFLIRRPIWKLKSDCEYIVNARKQIDKYQNKQLVIETLILNILEDNNG